MDVQLALSLLVMGLVLWALIPRPIRVSLRGGLGPLVHALADGVRAIARPVWRGVYGVLCRLYGVDPSEDAGPVVTSSARDERPAFPAVHPAPAPIGAAAAPAVQSHRPPVTDGASPAPGAALALTEEELQAVQRMLYAWRRAQAFGDTLSKTDAIKAGWGLGRSGSNPRYLRASVIYDALLGEPEPAVKYPTLTAQRDYQPPPR